MIGTLTVLVAGIGLGTFSEQEKEKRVCGMRKLIEAQWCAKCDGLRMKSLKEEHAKPGCDGVYRSVQLCDKSDITLYRCSEHTKEVDAKPGKCGTCGKDRAAVRGSIGRVAYRCGGCKAEGAVETELAHGKGCTKPHVAAYCTESGNAPHDDLSEIESKVIDIIVATLQVPRKKVSEKAALEKDLGADESDVVEIIMAIEDAFAITIADEDGGKFRTVGDLIGYVTERCGRKK